MICMVHLSLLYACGHNQHMPYNLLIRMYNSPLDSLLPRLKPFLWHRMRFVLDVPRLIRQWRFHMYPEKELLSPRVRRVFRLHELKQQDSIGRVPWYGIKFPPTGPHGLILAGRCLYIDMASIRALADAITGEEINGLPLSLDCPASDDAAAYFAGIPFRCPFSLRA